MVELVLLGLSLGVVLLLVFGALGLIRPSLAGVRTRQRAVMVYFGGAVICLVIAAPMLPESTGKGAGKSPVHRDALGSQSQGKPVPVTQLLQQFKAKTRLQRETWNQEHRWQYRVSGRCRVREVKATSWVSQITDADYEMDCALKTGDSAVLFFDAGDKAAVLATERNTWVTFTGRLKNLVNWEFWQSAYIRVEHFSTH